MAAETAFKSLFETDDFNTYSMNDKCLGQNVYHLMVNISKARL